MKLFNILQVEKNILTIKSYSKMQMILLTYVKFIKYVLQISNLNDIDLNPICRTCKQIKPANAKNMVINIFFIAMFRILIAQDSFRHIFWAIWKSCSTFWHKATFNLTKNPKWFCDVCKTNNVRRASKARSKKIKYVQGVPR